MSTEGRSEEFGRLLRGAINAIAAFEARTAEVVEEDLGHLIGLSGKTIQRYKGGSLPPNEGHIRVFAVAAMKRAYLGRTWLERFLYVAQYRQARQLIDELCAGESYQSEVDHIWSNLPWPDAPFIMREEPFHEIRDGLYKQGAIILITGLGGNGKTTLAREIADCSLYAREGLPQYNAAVWVSDKDAPGITTLDGVLNTVAITLNYPAYTTLPLQEKERKIAQLLRRERVLLVIDNFETIRDMALIPWLQRIPPPSKALVTTRAYSRDWRNSSWVVELRGMRADEAVTFIEQHLRRLRLGKPSASELQDLYDMTGGNPQAIKVILGIAKHLGRPISQILDDLYVVARDDIFDRLFATAWDMLLEGSRQILIALTFFPSRAHQEALEKTTGLPSRSFDRALEHLIDLALVDVHPATDNALGGYSLHPLMRTFVTQQTGSYRDAVQALRERWLAWCCAFSLQRIWNPRDLRFIAEIDANHDTLRSARQWAAAGQFHSATLALTKGLDHYYYIRGRWAEKEENDLLRIRASQALGQEREVYEAIALHAQILGRQGKVGEAESWIGRLSGAAALAESDIDLAILIAHARFFSLQAQRNYRSALEILASIEARVASDPQAPRAHLKLANRQWLALCHYELGDLARAEELFAANLADVIALPYVRAISFHQRYLAEIALDRRLLDQAATWIADAFDQATQNGDPRLMALILRSKARLAFLQGEYALAMSALQEALNQFERIGMRDELAEAQTLQAAIGAAWAEPTTQETGSDTE